MKGKMKDILNTNLFVFLLNDRENERHPEYQSLFGV